MNNTPKTKSDEHKVNPAVAAATGAVIGAGIAAAGAYVLKDEKNREKVKKVLSNVRDQALDYVENLEEVAKGEIKGELPVLKTKASKILGSGKSKKTANKGK